jgi:YVTN family beta-propeller protein
VYNGNGLFAAQNMMYRHTVTLYDEQGTLLGTIKDEVNLKQYGFDKYNGKHYLGGPVEACFSQHGAYLWVSNYSMLGEGFNNEGCDVCVGKNYDPSFVYKINTKTQMIENVIKVGAVPKFMAINEKAQLLLVSNWTSSDISIIDLNTEQEIKRVNVGRFPRGIAISKNGDMAYIAIMGGSIIAKLNLKTYDINYIKNVGKSPRHLILDKNDEYLYCAVNSANKVVKISLKTDERQICHTKSGPRSMILSENGHFIYVVNYHSDSFQKINAETMEVIETIKTGHHPIGITANWETSHIWVACYEGKLQVFKDVELEQQMIDEQLLANKGGYQPKIKKAPNPNVYAYFSQKLQKEIIKETYVKTQKIEQPTVIDESTTAKNEINERNDEGCKFHLIIGSFGVRSNAEKLQQQMLEKGYPAQLLPSTNQKMTMVSIQCFNTENEALSSRSKILQDTQQKGWVYYK